VLDPRSKSEHPGSRIWLFDPESARVMGSVRAGYDPDFALSPDGSHLYVASGERDSAELAVIDTASGKTLHVPFLDRVLYKPWYQGLPPYSRMEVTSDGREVRILVHHVSSPEKVGCAIYQVEVATQESRSTPTSDDCRAFPPERLRSPDNAKVYLGYGLEQTDLWAGLRALDTATGHILGGVQTSAPFLGCGSQQGRQTRLCSRARAAQGSGNRHGHSSGTSDDRSRKNAFACTSCALAHLGRTVDSHPTPGNSRNR
jgi:hypothetical protein